MKILIIGSGSIASKHIKAVQSIDEKYSFYALRHSINSIHHDGIHSIYNWKDVPKDIEFVLISNPTHLHSKTIMGAVKLNKPLFIEKPPVSSLKEWKEVDNALSLKQIQTYCGFVLRFHPLIEWLKRNINTRDVLEFHAYCGSYLPNWRKALNYTESYSSKKNEGGGVHLDLIHEIDYIIWLFGKPITSKGFVKKISNLEIDSFDSAHYYLEYMNTIGTITLNYFRKNPKRSLHLVLKNGALTVDLIKNTITDDKGDLVFSSKTKSADLMKKQMNYFIDCIRNKRNNMNRFGDTYDSMVTCLNVTEL